MRRVLLAVVALATPARAEPWTIGAEAGAEVDSNVERVETGPGIDTTPIASPVLRLGARVDHRDRALGGAYTFGLSDLTRIVGDPTASSENVTLLAGDLRWLHAIADRPVSLGFALLAADALPLSDPHGARAFRNFGGDGVAVVRGGERRLTFAFGGRAFAYKPDHAYDWAGPTASARLDVPLWQALDRARELELAASLGYEARAYSAAAYANGCAPGAPPSSDCSVMTSLARNDRYARAGVELLWTGAWVVAAGYQLTVIQSNSYGQSLVRHRATASTTVEVGGAVYATLFAVLQIDNYVDGLVLPTDPTHADFTNIEDENRSSLQVRLARKLSGAWSLEARAAAWRNIAGDTMHLAFARELVYLGALYAR
jgi:hypothetical protein